jgi:hypothetical protein
MKSNPCLAAILGLAALSGVLTGQDQADKPTKEVMDVSPDEKYAFLYTESLEFKSYDLIDQKSGKVLMRVADSDMAEGPGRFDIDSLLWKPDSKAFALTVWLEHRSSSVFFFEKDDKGFHKLKMPELLAAIPSKLTKGKGCDHVVTNNAQSATDWKKNGSLVVEIQNVVDGGDVSVGARRTVELTPDKSGKVKIVNSSVKYSTEKN